jgi:mRNA interferase MazF
VIVSNDLMGILPLKIVVPLTEWKPSFSKAAWQIKFKKSAGNGLEKTSSADCFQVRSIPENRLVRKLGQLHQSDMEKINDGLSICLALAAEFD